MAKANLASMSAAERLALANELVAFGERDAKLTTLVNAFKADLDAAGFTVKEVVELLAPSKPRGRKPGTKVAKKAASRKTRSSKKAAPRKKPDSQDKAGAMPVAGKTYVLPSGETWSKKMLGRPNLKFVAAIDAGKTWAELERRPPLKPRIATTVAKKAAKKRTNK